MTLARFRDLFVMFQFSLSPTATDWKSTASVFFGRVQSTSTISYDSQNGISAWNATAWSGLVVHADMGPTIYHLSMDVPDEARYATIGNSI